LFCRGWSRNNAQIWHRDPAHCPFRRPAVTSCQKTREHAIERRGAMGTVCTLRSRGDMQPRGEGSSSHCAKKTAAEATIHYDRLITRPRQVRDHLCRNRRIESCNNDSLTGRKCCGSLEDQGMRFLHRLHGNKFDSFKFQRGIQIHETWALLDTSRRRTRQLETPGSILSTSQPLGP
jgi:hypothetical protein